MSRVSLSVIRSSLFSLSVFSLIAAGSTAVAQSNGSANTRASANTSGSVPSLEAPAQVPAAQGTSTLSQQGVTSQYRLPAPTWGPYKLRAGLKTTNTSGRVFELEADSGKRIKQKHEYYLGFVHANGWGGYGQGVLSATSYGDSKRNQKLSGRDPSVTLLHPDFYKGRSLTVSGQARRYFATTEDSQRKGQKQWAYYVYTTYKMPQQWTLWNQATPRYFDQTSYKNSDTTFYFEDISNLKKSFNDWFALGVGQWTQVEWHARMKTGIATDAQLFARFTPIGNLSIEPRLLLPVYLNNSVYDAARSVSIREARAEIYAQMTL